MSTSIPPRAVSGRDRMATGSTESRVPIDVFSKGDLVFDVGATFGDTGADVYARSTARATSPDG
ncbi:MAG: hypothetical protein ACKOEX_10620 [Planctomycetia bacterium]